MKAEWLIAMLSILREASGEERSGVLSREELKPYIRLLLEDRGLGGDSGEDDGENGELPHLLMQFGDDNLLLMLECAEIYDVPKLFRLLPYPSKEMAVTAMKKVPPPYEKNPLLIIDRVFHAIREKSGALLEEAAKAVMEGDEVPADFSVNYGRFREIMMDEHILSLLYPKAK